MTALSQARHSVVTVRNNTGDELKPVANLLLHERHVAAGAEWSDTETGWKIVLVTRGNFYWIAATGTQLANTGDIVVIGPKAEGVLRASRIGDSLLHYFRFRPEDLAGLLSLVERMSLEGAASEGSVRVIQASEAAARDFRDLVDRDTRRRGFFQRCRILNLIGLIFDQAPLSHLPQTQNAFNGQLKFEQVIARIPDSELMDYSAEKLAELCGCSPRHFRRLFRKYFKSSIRAKQTELRLEKARRLLAETDEKIANVAMESGYHHLGFFNATFKRKFGVTPGEWRRTNAIEHPLRHAEQF